MNLWKFLIEFLRVFGIAAHGYTAGSAEFAARVAFTRRCTDESSPALYWRSLRRCLLWNLLFWPALLFAIRITIGKGWLLGWLGIPWILSCFLLLLVLTPLGIVYAVARGAATEETIAARWKGFTNFVKWTLLIELFIAGALATSPIENNRWDFGRLVSWVALLILLGIWEGKGEKFRKFAWRVALIMTIAISASFFLPNIFPALVGKYWETEASVGTAIKNGAIAGEEKFPFLMCADADEAIYLSPEPGEVRIPTPTECWSGFIWIPDGWVGSWRSIPNKGVRIWKFNKLPVRLPPNTPYEIESGRPFRVMGEGPISIFLRRFGEEPPKWKTVGPNDYGQPYRDPCSVIEAISLNESDIQSFNTNFDEPSCFWLFSKNASRYTFRIVAETAGLEVTTPKDNGFFWDLVPGEEELIEGAEMTIRGTGKASITAAPDPNEPTPNQDPNQ